MTDKKKQCAVLLKQAQAAMKTDDPAAALAACQEALSLDKSVYPANLVAGKASLALTKHEDAAFYYRAALKLEPDRSEALQGLAELYDAAGDHAAAAELLPKLVLNLKAAGKPGLVRKMLARLAGAASLTGDHQTAAQSWSSVIHEYAGAPGADKEPSGAALVSWLEAVYAAEQEAGCT